MCETREGPLSVGYCFGTQEEKGYNMRSWLMFVRSEWILLRNLRESSRIRSKFQQGECDGQDSLMV